MRRSPAPLALPLAFAFAALAACGDSGGVLDDAGLDAGPASPDARVPVRVDGGDEPAVPAPTLSAVSPGSGSELGGTRVVLRGTSILEPAEVFFGDQPATSVVVLDEVSIAATTPPGSPGLADVRVVTRGGTGELPGGFRYVRELSITAVSPARIPDEGGVPLRITGKGFDADTLIVLDREPLLGARLVDAEHIEGWAPSLTPGRPEIRAINREADAKRSDLLVVYGTPDVYALAPGFGPIAGGVRQELAGEGFEDATNVSIGGSTAGELERISGDRLIAVSPRLTPGRHDVTVTNRDTSGTLAGGYVAYDPARRDLEVLGVTPPRASTAGGDLIAVVGSGFGADTVVRIGGAPAAQVGAPLPNAITVLVPAGLTVGPADVVVSSALASVTATAAGALRLFAPIEVVEVTPAVGPATGGTDVTIRGSGFVSGARVRIGDVPLANVVVRGDGELTGTTVAGSHGPADVVVESDDTQGVLRGGFRYEEDFAIIRLEPGEGSVAGNTYVTVFGRGFDPPAAVGFGPADGVRPVVENGSVIGVRTPPSPTGPVDVEISIAGGSDTLIRAFSFYDPTLITGGAWGGPIEGDVNVAVYNIDSGQPIPGAVVQLGYDADLRYANVTDENGLTTISSPEIRGPQTITAGLEGFEFVTFMELDSRNLTIFAAAYPRSQSPEDPVPPCPTGGEPPVVRGKVYRVKSSLDPVTHPGWVPVVRITYSQPSVFAANPPMPAEQVDFVFADGEEYEIVVMRGGAVAVYGILYDYNPETQQQIPRRMAIARQVPAAPGAVVEDIHLSLDIELDESVVVRLDDPPIQLPGPTANAVFPYLNLQSEGVIGFPPTVVGTGAVTLTNLPRLATSQFFYMGGSFTDQGGGQLGFPYSLSLRESGEAFEAGLDLGPFVQMPQNVAPKPGRVLEGGALSWDQGGVVPDITTIFVVDSTFVSGCCCLDISGNGQCEDAEPQQCGGLPQQFNRWSIYGRGGLASYVMPAMISGLHAFESPNVYPWIVQQAVAPRFNYREFIYNQFSPYFWTSWSVWYSQFVSKEETPSP